MVDWSFSAILRHFLRKSARHSGFQDPDMTCRQFSEAFLLLPFCFRLGTESKNQNGNLSWHLPLGVRPPPLMAKFPDIFLPHFFSFAIESYIYETDFTLQKYHF